MPLSPSRRTALIAALGFLPALVGGLLGFGAGSVVWFVVFEWNDEWLYQLQAVGAILGMSAAGSLYLIVWIGCARRVLVAMASLALLGYGVFYLCWCGWGDHARAVAAVGNVNGRIHRNWRCQVVGVDFSCRSSVSDEDLVHLRSFPQLQFLSLAVNYEDITDSGLVHLEGLSNLRHLDLKFTGVTSKGLVHIENLKSLQYLDVCHTQVDDAGLRHLERLRNLRYLDLGATAITDAGLRHLRELQSLEYLDLSSTSVSDEGIGDIMQLADLKRIDLSSTRITRNGIRRLQEALPGCDVKPVLVEIFPKSAEDNDDTHRPPEELGPLKQETDGARSSELDLLMVVLVVS